MTRLLSWVLCVFFFGLTPAATRAQKNFGFDNRKPSGQPYWPPEKSLAGMQVPPGWEVKLVAAEPDVVNPVAFTIDERGRLWVLECFEYPKRTPKGKKPRDRIKIIEEVPGGKPKVTTWAEGKDLPIGWDLASGLEVGHGGVFLGAPPYLFFIKDENGKPGKQEILLKGFGSQDTHETLNTLQWGPDSKLYGLHGIFTQSTVTSEAEASAKQVKLNAAVWRYDVHQKKFDIFAEGTSNPWGMDFDAKGNCFAACCVIPHLFHIVPGGIYKRQAGTSLNPYAYGQLNEICDHTHHKESGWAHAGLLCLDGDHVPSEYRGSVLMGSIHGCCIKRDVLRPNGSSFIASCAPDFLTSADKNFRPINLRWGPDGSIYVIDWHDQNPCHQAAPDAWDYEHGRIYKITPKTPVSRDAQRSAEDLGKKTSKELVTEYLKNDNPYYYRTALRLLSERREKTEGLASTLKDLFKGEKECEAVRLRAVWGNYASGWSSPREVIQTSLGSDESAVVRAWELRLIGESGEIKGFQQIFSQAAAREDSPIVQLQLACTFQRPNQRTEESLITLFGLMERRDLELNKDPLIPLMVWLAYEPYITSFPRDDSYPFGWLRNLAKGNSLVTNEIWPRTLRRLAATGKADDLDECMRFLGVKETALRQKALEGLTLALKSKQVEPPPSWKRVFPELLKDGNKEVQDLARRLAVSFQDPKIIAQSLAVAANAKRQARERLDAVQDIALALPADGLSVLQKLVLGDDAPEIRAEACRALAGYDSPEIAKSLLPDWKSFPPAVRQEAVNLLAGRKPWAGELLAALGKGTVPRTDLTDNTILRIRAFKDSKLNELIEKHWGRFRDTPKELNALIDKMRDELYKGPGSFARGKVVFENNCAKCHKFDGGGFEVGPPLDGAARDIEYLLVNVIDPNRVVGQPYYVRLVELKNGRIETGLLAAEDNDSITLKQENSVLKVIQKKDIEGKVQVHEKSVMPEGLANNMTVQDFRDLIRYTMAHPFLTDVKVTTSKPLPPNAVNPLGEQDMKWQSPKVGPAGRIPLPGTTKGIVALVSAEVTVPASFKTRLLVGSGSSTQIWLNGKLVLNSAFTGSTPIQPDQISIDVELRAGRNEVIVQVADPGENGALYARFHDPDRKLRYPEAGKGK